MNADTVFWVVWSPQGGPPTIKHSTEAKAKAEAERLARTTSGGEFYVLRAVSCSQRVEIQTRDLVDAIGF